MLMLLILKSRSHSKAYITCMGIFVEGIYGVPLKHSIICLDVFSGKMAFVENRIRYIKPTTFVHNRFILNPRCHVTHSQKCLIVNLNIFDYYLGIVDHFRKGL